ncbi:hypothetical protein, partial [Corynebacterium bovis]
GAGVDAGTLARRIRDLLESGGELVTLLYTSAVPAETVADVQRTPRASRCTGTVTDRHGE